MSREIKVVFNPDGRCRPAGAAQSALRPRLARACGKRDARGQEMRPAAGSSRNTCRFSINGRSKRSISIRERLKGDVHPTAAPASLAQGQNRKRESTAMRILPRPIGTLILVAIAAASPMCGSCAMQHRHPPRVAEVGQTGRAASHAANPARRRLRLRKPQSRQPPLEPPARMTSAQQAGFDAWLVKTYLALLEAGPAVGRRRSLRRPGAARLQIRTARS